jgi:hypothetical protein
VRDEFKRIRAAILDAALATDIAEILLKEKAVLLEIKKASEEGYAAIMKAKDDRLAELEVQP